MIGKDRHRRGGKRCGEGEKGGILALKKGERKRVLEMNLEVGERVGKRHREREGGRGK